MKKIALILVTLFTLLSLCACFGGDGGGEDSGEKVIFSKDTQLTVIRGEGAPDTDELSQVINKIRDATGRMPVLRDAFAEKQEHEIIFGDTDRELTKAAKELLVGDGDTELSYVIYSDGTSVAVVYRDNADGIARRAATEELIAAFRGKDSLVMDAGAYKAQSIDVMEYYEELGEKQKSDAYAALTRAAEKIYFAKYI